MLPAPRPLVRSQREVDALYDVVRIVTDALRTLHIPYVTIAGSLLGAVRSSSFLFCDDDADIAVFEDDYPRVLAELPRALASVATYVKRPWPVADRVRPRHLTHVWVDVFVLKRFDTLESLKQWVSTKANGTPQPREHVDRILAGLEGAVFPLWHYDTPKGIDLWPCEWLTSPELFPLSAYDFGHLSLHGPAHPVRYLRRAYGSDVFDVYRLATQHAQWSAELRSGAAGDNTSSQSCVLEDVHYTPLPHSRHKREVVSHTHASLLEYLAIEDAWGGAMSEEGKGDALHLRLTQARLPTESTNVTPVERWLGASLAEHTGHSAAAFVFTPTLLRVMEPHIEKARIARTNAEAASTLSSRARAALYSSAFLRLAAEEDLSFDLSAHPLHEALASALGLPPSLPLSHFHVHAHGIEGGKHAITARLREDAVARATFSAVFTSFILSVIAPRAVATMASGAGRHEHRSLYIQAWPCIRILQPGEFSLGAHCDSTYGFSPANVNFVVPLTHASGASALHIESIPGAEDWHAVDTAPGSIKRFWGSRCLHWTSENTSDETRVSLDFRVIPGDAWDAAHDQYSLSPGYYARCEVCDDGTWAIIGGDAFADGPDWRVGYPFGGVRRGGHKTNAALGDAT